MGPYANAALGQLVVKREQAVLEPRAFDPDLEVLEAKLQQLLVGQCGPGEFPTRHGASKPDTQSLRRWCHERPFSTTGPVPDARLGPAIVGLQSWACNRSPQWRGDLPVMAFPR